MLQLVDSTAGAHEVLRMSHMQQAVFINMHVLRDEWEITTTMNERRERKLESCQTGALQLISEISLP